MQLETAETELAQAEERLGKQNPQLVPILESLARLYQCDGLYAKAELVYRRAADVLAATNDEGPQAVDLAFKLGMLYRAEGKLDDAESVYLRGLSWVEKDASPESKRGQAERLCCLAGLYCEKNQFAQAEQLLNKAAAMFTETFGQNNYYSRLSWLGLAVVCRKLGKTGEADEFATKAAYTQTPSATSGDRGAHSDERAIIELARMYYAQGRYVELEELLNPVLFADEEKLWPDNPRVGKQLHVRGELFRAQGQWDDAERTFRKALEVRLKALGPSHEEVGATAMSLAVMLLSLNRYTDTEPVLKLALKTRVRAFGVEHPSVAASIETYSALLKRTKRPQIAQKLDARARDIRAKLVWNLERATAPAKN